MANLNSIMLVSYHLEYLAFTEWVHNLRLSMLERDTLCSGGLLTATHISAANSLLRKRFKLQNGLQDSHYLAVKQEWNSAPEDFVQIIFIKPGHWSCLSNRFCTRNVVELFDSMHTEPTEQVHYFNKLVLLPGH